ncbi:MAG: flavin reductase family protein [Lachnospirales bacterium]
MKKIDVLDYSNDILNAVKKGVLITTKNNEKVNTMAISWGTLGIQWNKPIFITFVRANRFTKFMLDETLEFTVNIPCGEYNKNIIALSGTKSGHNVDKVKELNLTLVDGEMVNVPAIKELPLTLECKVVYKQLQDRNAFSKEYIDAFYPQDVDSSFHGSNKDFHIAFYGEIVNAYILD